MRTGHSLKKGFGVFGVVGMIMISLLIIPTESEAQSEWVQTTQADFDNATTKWNVDTVSDPGNVSLVPSPFDWIRSDDNPVMLPQKTPGTVLERDDGFKMWYSYDVFAQSKIGYADSPNGFTWTEDPLNPLLPYGTWDSVHIGMPSVVWNGSSYHMLYAGHDGGLVVNRAIGHAISPDGGSWVKDPAVPVFASDTPGFWDGEGVSAPNVILDNGVFKMWYSGYDGSTWRIGLATSTDGITWTRSVRNPVLDVGPSGAWDAVNVSHPSVFNWKGLYYMLYVNAWEATLGSSVGLATSTDGENWTKHPGNPIFHPGEAGEWDAWAILKAIASTREGNLRLWFGGWDGLTARVGLATAAFGTRFQKEPSNPVLQPGPKGSWDEGGIGAPSAIKDGSKYRMWYNSNGKMGLVESADGHVWTRISGNPVFTEGAPGSWEEIIAPACVILDADEPLYQYKMWYTGWLGGSGGQGIGYAYSTDGIQWTRHPSNPVVVPDAGSWDSKEVKFPTVVKDGAMFRMWYTGVADDDIHRILYAYSNDGIVWTKHPNPVLEAGPAPWEANWLWEPWVVLDDGGFRMVYSGGNGWNGRLGVATSSDGISWTKYSGNPILDWGPIGSWDFSAVVRSSVLKEGNLYRMWYHGFLDDAGGPRHRIGEAFSLDGYNWTKRAVNPVLDKGAAGEWDDSNVNGPHVHLENGLFRMWFSGNYYDTGQMGYAESQDGLYWTKHASNPVLEVGATDSWDDAEVLWGSVVESEGNYEMWYSGSDGTSIVWEIGYASSPDGLQWTKPNLGLMDYGGNTNNNIVLDRGPPGSADSDALASPFVLRDSSGSYRMWYSCRDSTSWRICHANSTDGTIWTRSSQNPVLDLGPPGAWDSNGVGYPSVVWNGFFYQIWYEGNDGADWGIGVATSQDGINWTRSKLNPILEPGAPGSWDETFVNMPMVLLDGEQYRMWFMGGRAATDTYKIGYASSQYSSVGTLHSSILGSGTELTWTNISWDALTPDGTLLAVSIRTGDTPVPDATWTDWTEDIWNSTRFDISAVSRYLQYRVTFVSLDGEVTPILSEVRVGYEENTAMAPSLLSPDDGTWTPDSTPTFSWTFNDLEGDIQTAFVVEVEDNSSFTAIDYTSEVAASSDESWTITAELAQGTWYWRVRTQESNGSWSGNSTVWSFEVDTPPSAPTGLVVEPGERGALELTWDANPEDDIEGYYVFRSDSSGGPYDKINDVLVPSPSYNDTELPDGTTFYYTVTAVDLRDQESSPSPEASGTTVEEMDFLSEYWWILLLIILIVIVIIILVVRRKKPEEEEPEEEKPAEEEETVPEPLETEMTDEDRLQKLERRHEEGDISEETYNELKKRYGGEPE